jgi:hypothetical protein
MKRSVLYHSFVAAIALSVWIAFLFKIITSNGQWLWMLNTLIPDSVFTIVLTAFLCRFWVARKKLPSFGTFIIVPFCIAYLVWGVLCFSYVRWEMFTADYWQHRKGTLRSELFHQGLIGAICVFPAVAVVIYYHGRSKKDDPKWPNHDI